MYCPNCESATLSEKEIITGLLVKECSRCHGQWISSSKYEVYLNRRDERSEKLMYNEFSHENGDSLKGKICPDCGHILVKFKVGHGIDFYLDHCLRCNGIWMDANEFKVLYSHGLHDELNKVFTTQWQKKVRKDAHQAAMELVYREKFGAKYEILKDLREWMQQQKNRSIVIAYLND